MCEFDLFGNFGFIHVLTRIGLGGVQPHQGLLPILLTRHMLVYTRQTTPQLDGEMQQGHDTTPGNIKARGPSWEWIR